MNSQRPNKNTYFMNLAEAIKVRSPDPKTQVGAVLVDDKDRVIGTGYNGPPPGFPDASLDWSDRDSIYPYVIHAEVNCILHSSFKFNKSTVFVTLSPCKECIKIIACAGIKRIVYKEAYRDIKTVEILAKQFGIDLVRYIDTNE